MKKFFLLLILIPLSGIGFSQVKLTVVRSTISFHIRNMGINTGGSISGLQADIKFIPADLAASAIEASVETNTLNTENDSRDEHLKSADYFDVARYPKIILKSVSFKHKTGTSYLGVFNLTIRDKTKLIDMPFTYDDKKNADKFEGTFKINRLDFGVGSNSLILSNEVLVNIVVETSR